MAAMRLGEQCVLAFTYAQNRNLGVGFIAYAGGIELKHRVAQSGADHGRRT